MFLLCVSVLFGCSSARLIKRTDSRANVQYMPSEAKDRKRPANNDTVVKRDPIISYMGRDSNMVYLIPAVWDSVNQESVAMIHIAAVTVTGNSVRQVAERNGKINIDFMVAVPKEMQRNSWQVNVYPFLRRGLSAADSLEAIQLTGSRFRALQYRDYAAYEDYLGRIIPDSADFFGSFVNARGFYNYLSRLDRQRARLNSRLNQPGRNVDNLLMERFVLFNAKNLRMDSARGRRLFTQQHLIYSRNHEARSIATVNMRPMAKVNDPLLAIRFSHFNGHLEGMKYTYVYKKQLSGALLASATTKNVDFPERYFQREIPPVTYIEQPSGYDKFRYNVTGNLNDPLSEQSRYNLGSWLPRSILYERDTMGLRLRTDAYNYRQRLMIESELGSIAAQDSSDVVKNFVERRKIALNEKMKAEKDVMRDRMIPFPLRDGLRLDTVISTRDTLYYKYTQAVTADENTSKLYVYLNGDMVRRSGMFYRMPESDTLTFNVSSMTNFIDDTPRYIQKVISRDAESNSSFAIAFPRNKSTLVETFENNQQELQKVRDMISKLMNDPVYIIDSISVCAYSSPEGTHAINKRFADERSRAFGGFMSRELKMWSDSLSIHGSVVMDEFGVTHQSTDVQQQYPDLSKSLRLSSVAENWDKLAVLIAQDENVKNAEAILSQIASIQNQDARENAIRRAYPADYNYIREAHYQKLRVVDVKFNLHRRGMLKDTIHTTELDSVYMEGIRLLKARKYSAAIELLRPYDNVNTAIAYMSLGYDDAALRIFGGLTPTGDIVYTMAILYARKGDPSRAVEHLMRAVEINSRLRFRANLDPELSALVKTYNLFAEEDDY